MTPDQLLDLTSIIEANNHNTLPRKIQQLATQARHSRDATIKETASSELALHEQAKKFLEWESTAPVEINTSMKTLRKIGYWLCEQTAIENYNLLAIHGFKLHFDSAIPAVINPLTIIPLGKAFIADPLEYAAFLFYLSQNATDPEDITHSGITQDFFAYHVTEINTITETYTLLDELSNETKRLVQHLKSSTCGIRGLINNPSNSSSNIVERYTSYNLSGTRFNHQHMHADATIGRNPTRLSANKSLDHTESTILFQLFGWGLIRALQLKYLTHEEILKHILHSDQITDFLQLFASKVLSGEIEENKIKKILDFTRAEFSTESLNEKQQALLNNNPFLIHVIKNKKCLAQQLPQVIDHFNSTTYQTVHHLKLLNKLHKRILHENIQVTAEVKNKILGLIFQTITPIGNKLNDEHIDIIFYCSNALCPFFEEFIQTYFNSVLKSIEGCVRGNIDFFSLENTWGENLPMAHLYRHIYGEDAPILSDSPTNKYQLHQATIKHAANLTCKNTKAQFKETFQLHFKDQPEYKIRLLKQTLLGAKDKNLIDFTLTLFTSKADFLEEALQQHTSGEKTLTTEMISTENTLLFQKTLDTTTEENQLKKYKNHIFSYLKMRLNTKEKFNFYCRESSWNVILFITNHIPNYEPIQECLKELFIKAVSIGSYNLVIFLANLNNSAFLSAALVKRALLKNITPDNCINHNITLLLCGMTGDVLKSTAIRKNNYGLFFSYISTLINAGIFHRQSEQSRLTEVYHNNNNILHLAASHNNVIILKKIVNTIEEIFSGKDIHSYLTQENSAGVMPTAAGNSPNARAINKFLDEMRLEYTPRDNQAYRTEDADNSQNIHTRERSRVVSPRLFSPIFNDEQMHTRANGGRHHTDISDDQISDPRRPIRRNRVEPGREITSDISSSDSDDTLDVASP